MATNQVEGSEDTVVSFSKNRTQSKITALIQDNIALDAESFLEDLAESLGVEVEDLPVVRAEVVVYFGNSTIRTDAFEAPEKDEEDDEDA